MPFASTKERNRYMKKYLRRWRKGIRTPQPSAVDIDLMKEYATTWAERLRVLRYGRPGELYLVADHEMKQILGDRIPPQLAADDGTPIQQTVRCFIGAFQPQIQWVQKLLNEQPPKEKVGNWDIVQPVFPEPDVWKDLTNPRSTTETLRSAFSRMEIVVAKWLARLPQRERFPGGGWETLIGAAQENAANLRKAKRLLQYPTHPNSDRKRIEFFAKVLAGLALGRTPLYTLRILAGWHPSTLRLLEMGIEPIGENLLGTTPVEFYDDTVADLRRC